MNIYTPTEALASLPPSSHEPPPFAWLPQLLQFLRRRWPTVAASVCAALSLAVLYLLLATPQFTATTALVLDIRRSNPFRQQPIVADSLYENAQVESQVEIVRSEGLARSVVLRHDLMRDPDFTGIGNGIIGSTIGFVSGLFGKREPASGETMRSLAVQKLTRMISVRRVGLTAVIEVSVRTPDRQLSARLANAVVDSYLQSQLAALSDISTLASGWMQTRIKDLRDEAIAADRAVQEYKAQNNLLETDKGKFNEQQLGEYSSQLSAARARLAEAQAKVALVSSVTADRLANAPLAETLENTIIVGLRKQYLDARRRESEWSARYGVNHTAAVNARTDMRELQRSIQNELNRISETYRGELEVARSNEAQLSQQLATLAAASATADADRIMLRALQSSADSYKAIYENFLQRYTQAVQDQSFPIPEARVMTSAVPPLRPSSPNILLVVALGTVAGLFIGFGVAVLRELLDRGMRTPAQVKAATGHDCVGLIPRLPGRLRNRTAGREADPATRQLSTRPSTLRQVADQSDAAFAEAMRGIALRATWWRRTPGSLVVGCSAPRAGEGATTVAANLAQAFVEAGYRTLLVDLDLRRADLTHALAPRNGGGAAEIAEGGVTLDQAIWRDPQTGLHFLPAAASRSVAHPARVLAPARADRLLASLRANYERVVIDLPAFGTNADAGALAGLLDGLLLVTAWGGLSGETLAELLNGFQSNQDKLLGVVLNRVELGRLNRYGVGGYAAASQRKALA